MQLTKWLIFFIIVTLTCEAYIAGRVQYRLQPPEQKKHYDSISSEGENKNDLITYKLIPGINNTWGYDILVDGRMKIHQPSVPGQPGNDGFKTKEGSEKVAKLVIKKMKKGEMPPTVTGEELKKLKVK